MQIFHLGRVVSRAIKRHAGNLFFRNRNIEARAELAQGFFAQFFSLMRRIAAFGFFAQAVAFDGFRQNHCRLTFVLNRGLISRIDFFGIVTAAPHFVNVVVGKVFGEVL